MHTCIYIYIYTSISMYTYNRVVLESIEYLRANGHKVVQFVPPKCTYDLVLAWGTLYCADGGKDQLDGTYNNYI
jgi:hypothetical protein